MNLLSHVLLDLGCYAAAVVGFAGITCYRANRTRALNQVYAVFLFSIGCWQILNGIARWTRSTELLDTLLTVFGTAFVIMLYLMYDACAVPRSSLWARLKRCWRAWLSVGGFAVAMLLNSFGAVFGNVGTGVLATVVVLVFIGASLMLPAFRKQDRARNTYETFLCRIATVYVGLIIGVHVLVPTRLDHWVTTAVTLIWGTQLTAILLSERVFQSGGTAKIVMVYIIRLAIHVLLFVPVVVALLSVSDEFHHNVLFGAVFLGLFSYPIWAATEWTLQQLIGRAGGAKAAHARERAVLIVSSTESEAVIQARLEELVTEYLKNVSAAVAIIGRAALRDREDPKIFLAQQSFERALTPEQAVKSFAGDELDAILDAFERERLGAVVKYVGHKASVVLYIGQRARGDEPISSEELDTLYEMASIAGTGVDRIRAVTESFRAQSLAMVGRFAADFSHSARNQIAAIQTLVEAVRDGETSRLSKEYREAVYKETMALAASHAMALEITRLRADKVVVQPMPVDALIHSVVASYGRIAQKANGEIQVMPADPAVMAADESLLRQVLLNLIRNGIQAATFPGNRPLVTLRVMTADGMVHIDVVDNGPGVSPEIFDHLFMPWATSKPDGTGLGLSFCMEATRLMGGSIAYLTPRGLKNAWFRVSIPEANSAAASAA